MKKQCGNCEYYNPKEALGPDVGECVVNPPIVVVITNEKGKNEPTAYYPVVAHDQPGCRFFNYVAKPTIALDDEPDDTVNPNLKD